MRERSAQEIIDRIESHNDIFNFSIEVLCAYLSFDEAQPLIDPGKGNRAEWERDVEHADKSREATLARMRDYMEFAWTKAQDHRGLSAIRSLIKIGCYVWLLGDDEAASQLESERTGLYGAAHLRYVCHRYNLPIPDDEGIQRMAEGRPCRDDCDEGCR